MPVSPSSEDELCTGRVLTTSEVDMMKLDLRLLENCNPDSGDAGGRTGWDEARLGCHRNRSQMGKECLPTSTPESDTEPACKAEEFSTLSAPAPQSGLQWVGLEMRDNT